MCAERLCTQYVFRRYCWRTLVLRLCMASAVSELPVQVEAEKTELLEQLEFMGGKCPPPVKVACIKCSTLSPVVSVIFVDYVAQNSRSSSWRWRWDNLLLVCRQHCMLTIIAESLKEISDLPRTLCFFAVSVVINVIIHFHTPNNASKNVKQCKAQ